MRLIDADYLLEELNKKGYEKTREIQISDCKRST